MFDAEAWRTEMRVEERRALFVVGVPLSLAFAVGLAVGMQWLPIWALALVLPVVLAIVYLLI